MADNTGQDDQIIELTDIVDDVDDDIIELIDIDPAPDGPEVHTVHPDEAAVSQQQVEAALERIIEKKFSEKIDIILFDVMERVISREIREIRENLQKDLDQIGTS
ncbi:MAG: hypothetical protein V2J08_11700 [Desulfotignum sp.]|jgi:hypothetical protein|nr:hypothetical protein [Desulfotignum sp.]